MAILDRLKLSILIIFVMTIVLLVTTFYYTANLRQNITLQMKYAGMLQNGLFNSQTLFSKNTALLNLSHINVSYSTFTHAQFAEGLDVNHLGQDKSRGAWNKQLCPEKSPTLVGPLKVNTSVSKMEDVEMLCELNVSNGGSWKPTECQARSKMALIIPFRNRYEQLSIFIRHMHPVLKKQNLDYRIFIVEQGGHAPFNRAMLFNIGFKEALKYDDYECFIFHDVDLLPEDDRNEYSCPSSPRHMSVAVDKFNYRLPYTDIFGGAGSFSREHFELINGYSNIFWGWGGEDDNLFKRIKAKGLKLTRPSTKTGRYKMLKIFHVAGTRPPTEIRVKRVIQALKTMNNDGLNSLNYSAEVTEHLLFTMIKADFKPELSSD